LTPPIALIRPITGAVAVNGVIGTTDGTDTALLTGEIGIDGVIITTDENDVALLIGGLGPEPTPSNIDTHDGFHSGRNPQS